LIFPSLKLTQAIGNNCDNFIQNIKKPPI